MLGAHPQHHWGPIPSTTTNNTRGTTSQGGQTPQGEGSAGPASAPGRDVWHDLARGARASSLPSSHQSEVPDAARESRGLAVASAGGWTNSTAPRDSAYVMVSAVAEGQGSGLADNGD